jgi:malonate transporter
MSAFSQYFLLSAPLFALVMIGYAIASWRHWRGEWTALASKFVFNIALPAMLFHFMSDFSSLPPANAKLLIAFFGGCFIVFLIGRLIAARFFRLDAAGQSVFAMGGIFSNNVMLGLPIARVTLGPEAVPSVALVVVFNALTLWTLVSVAIEWSKHASFSVRGIGKMTMGILTSPIVAAVLSGTAFGLTGLNMPHAIDIALALLSSIAAPAALISLGMGLVQYGVREGWRQSVAITAIKLIVAPIVVWILARALGLPVLETRVIVLLASMAVGANVYLMSMQFQAVQGPVASALVLSTALASITTPIFLAATAAFGR